MRAWIVILVVVSVFFGCVYAGCNLLNPDSWWCLYKIYRQPDGTYEVWWSAKTRHLEQRFQTYEQAKKFQVRECHALDSCLMDKPHGQRVK